MEIGAGTFVRVVSNFESNVDGDLNLIDGDIVKVKSVVNDDWLEGIFGEDIGIFPSSHCIALQLTSSSDPFGVALYSHEAHLHDELSFEAGDQVFFTSRVNPEWYNGTCQGRCGMFPISYVSIVVDLPVLPARPAVPPTVPTKVTEDETQLPERPKSLDASTIASLRSKSLSKRNSVHPSDNPEASALSPKRPPSLQPPNFPPPAPPTQIPPTSENLTPTKSLTPQRPPSISSRPSPPRPASYHTDSGTDPQAVLSQPAEAVVPSRPPPLDTVTVSELRERSRSQGKKSKDQSPSRPPSTYLETPPVLSSELSQPDQDDHNVVPPEEATPLCPSFTPVSHPGLLDWNVDNVEDRPLYVEDSTHEEEEVLEAEYANQADIQAVEEEYKTTAAEDAAIRKIHKSIAEKEKMLMAEQESKMQTEDLLAQQFSGKKIDKENVELLRSLLNAHNEKIAELCNKIDAMKAKSRTLKSPTQKSDKLDGIEKRDKVVIELIETEESNLKELRLCINGFLHTLRNDTTHSMDIDMMFLNIENIAVVAEKLLMMLRGQQTLMSHEQMIGRCFTHLEEDLHREYTFYLENQASVMELIAQYQKDKVNKELLDSCLQKIREDTTCWDLQSFLIRPVQRIMKYPLFLRDMLVNTPAHWLDRPFLVSASEIVDNIVVYANENKRKDELLKRYNEEVTDSSLLPKLTLHSLKKKSKRLTTTLTHSLNITSSAVEDSTFGQLSEKFGSLVLIIKTLIREASTFTDLLKKVQVEMDELCANIHNFYDNLETQKNVFLYHGAALKIAQNYTPRFIRDLEEGPLGTLSDLLAVFTAPQYFIEKRNSKILDYDNLYTQAADGSLANENLKIARGEFEALNRQLLDDLPILIHEGAEVVKKSSYSVLALFCQYSQACHDEFRRALDKMSLELDEAPDSIYQYHLGRMKTCCATLLTISSFDKEVTQAIVLGSTMKPAASKFYEGDVGEEEQTTSSYDVNKWLENQPDDVAALSSDEDEDDMLEDVFEKPGVIEDVLTATVCRVLYDFSATSDAMLDVRSGDTVTLLSDCLISDTWAYVKRGEEKGYVPKSYLTLSGTLKNKPAPQPPSKTNPIKGKSIKRRAPPPPQRTVSEVSLPISREPVEKIPSDPVLQPPPPETTDPVPLPPSLVATYTTVNKTTRLQPKRTAPPPPMSRRNTAPVLLHKDRTLEQMSNLEDTSDSSGCGMLAPLPEDKREVGEEKLNVLDLSSNLDDIDLLSEQIPASAQSSSNRNSFNDHTYDNITALYSSTDDPTLNISTQLSDLNLPNPVPVPIPLKSEAVSDSSEPYYEVIESDISSEYGSLPPPPPSDDVIMTPPPPSGDVIVTPPQPSDDVIMTPPQPSDEVITVPPEVFSSPVGSLPAPPEDEILDEPQSSKSETDVSPETRIHVNSGQHDEISVPQTVNSPSQPSNIASPHTCPTPTSVYTRSASVSVSPHTHTAPSVPRSASVSVPTRLPEVIPPKTAVQRNTGPVIPTSPVPKPPTKTKDTKRSPMFDECPMEMSMVRKQESSTNYEAQHNYRARSPAELSLSIRQVVSVVDASDKDWWFVKAGRRQGFVPANFLKMKS